MDIISRVSNSKSAVSYVKQLSLNISAVGNEQCQMTWGTPEMMYR